MEVVKCSRSEIAAAASAGKSSAGATTFMAMSYILFVQPPLLAKAGMDAGGFSLSWEGALVLTAIVGVIFLLLSLVGFRSKILDSIPDVLKSGIAAGGGTVERYPMIAPALIFVGVMMMRAISGIEWEDMTEAVPGFLTIVTMPFAFSISAGIAIGFISYAFAKVITGRWRQCPLIVYIFAVLFILRYALGS